MKKKTQPKIEPTECLCVQPTVFTTGYACPLHASPNMGVLWSDDIRVKSFAPSQEKYRDKAIADYLEDWRK